MLKKNHTDLNLSVILLLANMDNLFELIVFAFTFAIPFSQISFSQIFDLVQNIQRIYILLHILLNMMHLWLCNQSILRTITHPDLYFSSSKDVKIFFVRCDYKCWYLSRCYGFDCAKMHDIKPEIQVYHMSFIVTSTMKREEKKKKKWKKSGRRLQSSITYVQHSRWCAWVRFFSVSIQLPK